MPSPLAPSTTPSYPAIPEPQNDIASLRATVVAMKEALELLTGQRARRDETEYSVQGMLRQLEVGTSRVYELTQVGEGLARRIDLVETSVDDVSAEGQIVISAEANPSGFKAYFGVYLRANADTTPGTERRAGMHLGLDNLDGGYFALDVDRFQLRDNSSGTLTSVFTYSGGVFTMTGNVTINGSLLVTGTVTELKIGSNAVTNPKIQNNAVSVMAASENSGQTATVNVTLRDGSKVLITGLHKGNPATANSAYTTGVTRLKVEGSVISSVNNNYFIDGVGLIHQLSTIIIDIYTVPSAGTYTIQVESTVGLAIGGTIVTVTELSK